MEIQTFYFVVFWCALITSQVDCKGGRSSSGGSRTSHSGGSHSYGHSSSSHSYGHSSGGSSYHPTSHVSTSYHVPNYGSTHTSGISHGNTAIHQTHVNPLNSGHPSAPIHPTNQRPIGFDNIHSGTTGPRFGTNNGLSSTHTITGGVGYPPTHGSGAVQQPHGFDNHNQQRPTGTQGGHNIGFENVHNRLPSQNGGAHQPITPHNQHPLNSGVNQNTYPNTHHTVQHSSNRPYPVQTYHHQLVQAPTGAVYYHPPAQLQYVPPVTQVHVVPIYHPPPTIIYSQPVHYGNSYGTGHATSFLSGYLIGRASGFSYDPGYNHVHHHTTVHHTYDSNSVNTYNDYDRESSQNNHYYTVHNHFHNREEVPRTFSVPGNSVMACPSNTSELLCVPNTNAICLKNETIMCTTYMPFTTPCEPNSTLNCVYTKLDCKGDPSCNQTTNQTYVEYYLPCISNVTLVNDKLVDETQYKVDNSYQLCVTAIAEPKKLNSPVGSLVELVGQSVTQFWNFTTEALRKAS